MSRHELQLIDKYASTKILETLNEIRQEIQEKEYALNCVSISDVALKTAYLQVMSIIDDHIERMINSTDPRL